MWTRIVALWNNLPHYVQAVIMAFGAGLFGVLWNVVKQWANGQQVCTVATWPCVESYLVSGVKAGIIAVIGLYTKSSYHKS